MSTALQKVNDNLEAAGSNCNAVYTKLFLGPHAGAVPRSIAQIAGAPPYGDAILYSYPGEADEVLQRLHEGCDQCGKSGRRDKCHEFVDSREEVIRAVGTVEFQQKMDKARVIGKAIGGAIAGLTLGIGLSGGGNPYAGDDTQPDPYGPYTEPKQASLLKNPLTWVLVVAAILVIIGIAKIES